MAVSKLNLLQTLTTTTLTLVSFIFTILALTTSTWSSSAQYTSTTPPNINNRHLQGSSYRGPYRDCPLLQNATTLAWSNVCSTGTCFASDAALFGGPWWCQQLNLGAKLLLAGSVFTGIGFVSCAVGMVAVFLAGRKRHGSRARRRDGKMVFASWRWFTSLMLVTAVGTSGVGWAITANLLVNQQKFDGNYITSLPVPVTSDHWLMGKGTVYGAVGWVPTVVAIVCLPWRPLLERREHEEGGVGVESRKKALA
ncbi:hypothetical protein B0J14DRAFT_310612 [Halenospora varia]|nr:hypothetical protein B0J14DRAFT_310612 [Halenospora varia]